MADPTDRGDAHPPDAESELRHVRQAVVDTLVQAAIARQFDDPAIRSAIAAYTTAARRAGRPPEWVVIDVKKLVALEAVPELGDWFRSVLRDRLVAWSISDYFGLPSE